MNTTVSILNQDNIDNLNFWLQKNFNTNRFTDPIEHRKQQCFGILSTHNKDLIKITKYLDSLDYRRGTSWKNTFPELMEYLKS